MDLRDEEGRQRVGLTRNEKSSARYHSDWLNMMYPRLILARNLLKDSGVIFISIDDNEQANLKALCDEVFGEGNFLANIVWEKVHTRKNSSKYFSTSHEHILAIAKHKELWDRVLLPREGESAYKNPDNHPKGPWKLDPITAHNPYNADYTITKPNGIVLSRPKDRYWAFSEETIKEKINNNEIYWGEGDSYPMIKRFLSDAQDGLVPITIFDRKFAGDTSSSKKELDKLMGDRGIFDYSKPIKLIQRLMQISTRAHSTVLDFFAGSATTAHAVMQLNAEDGGNRKYILCTLDEKVADKSAAKEAGYDTIDQISRERIRRAAAKIQEEHPERVGQQDFGFKAFKLDESNFKNVSKRPDAYEQGNLFDSVSNIKEDRTDLDLLFQIMLAWGMELSLSIQKTSLDGVPIYNVAEGALIACFSQDLTESVIREIAQQEPLRAIFKDSSFANSAAKINLTEIFKEISPMTKVKVV